MNITSDEITKLATQARLPACHLTHPKSLKRFATLIAKADMDAPAVDYEWHARLLSVELQSLILCLLLYKRDSDIEKKCRASAQRVLDDFRQARKMNDAA